ncbi:WSC domain-containing protein 2 isoform X1 [Panthera pardus]|uniref:WSC domain containing 2 n=3 Tax=Felidae TaxID=9681 RepID=A0A8C8WYG6_PANLE|nr:WSC domain-containing protein 2 isoform X2 [Panthera leo]XP_043413734.1 WSC domain-containing protein 2 [Prionailurus bengalensis]XP_043413735.1 WSC domain-containing protein 2 [Prionailurus bengalensis]XP_043413736.1 WSC domain-containing protein 2 [Prionailurus bengalensis]XP_046944336.1 WSC domain-containing protein 2 [Lynx rufus]XP_053758084.1 WSC domain-containing protein 2 isoform X1 [Panthera pardus]XP_053758085.1 WSC domain-containing protein 2 isoform X1 [Panthera pardus]XP_05375
MAKLWFKFQRYFRRKPVRFFTFLVLYLTAGSLVFLHSGFVGQPAISQSQASPAAGVQAEGAELPFLGDLHLGRGFRDTGEASNIARRYGPWFKGKDGSERAKLGDYGGAWSRALKGRIVREKEEERAKYIGCYLDDTQSRALRGVSFFDYKKMTIFRCQDNCAERGYLYAGLEFGAECYCGHKIQATNVSEAECDMECKGERGSVCGGANRLSVFRLQLAQESARRYGSAVFRGCFRRPDNLSLALPVTAAMPNMSVDKCVDLCTEKEYPLAALAGTACHCGFPTTRFPLHEREDEQLCAQKCSAEEFESCGTPRYFIVYQTQVQDNRCMDRRFLPAKSKQLIALASFPGAGNTWARHLIELATGFYTGSYYFDGSLYNKGFKGERDHWRSGRTICIKTHESGQKEIEAFDAAILLIRNPYKALMAEFNRKYGGHIGFAAHAHWKGKEWPEFVRNYAPWWATHTLDWLKFGKKVLVVHFEDLKRDLFVQLGRMVSLLGVAVREDRLLCVESQKDGNFKRSGLRKLEYDPYTADMQKVISAYIKMVDAALKGRNLTGVPDDYYPR